MGTPVIEKRRKGSAFVGSQICTTLLLYFERKCAQIDVPEVRVLDDPES